MSAAESLLEAQTVALLRRLAREQGARARRIADDAAAQGADIVRKARAEARARVHQAVVETRREQQQALVQRRAALETRARQRQQAALGDWLRHAWRALPDALQARWDDPAARAQWCAAAMQAASRDLLQRDAVQVEADVRWLADVRQLVAAHCAADLEVTVVACNGLGAGLRIRGGPACVDATVAGLLAPRERIAAELLGEIARQAPSPHAPSTP
jgi:vacuolar-type H+-ATPase subunit E/Vma4